MEDVAQSTTETVPFIHGRAPLTSATQPDQEQNLTTFIGKSKINHVSIFLPFQGRNYLQVFPDNSIPCEISQFF